MFYSNMWDQDLAHLFDDAAERELLVQQFDEMISNAKKPPSIGLDIDGHGAEKVLMELINKTSETYQSECFGQGSNQRSVSDSWRLCAAECKNYTAMREMSEADERAQTQKRKGMSHPEPNDDVGSLQMQVVSRRHNSQCLPPVPQNHKFVAVVKLPDGNLYMATTGSNALNKSKIDYTSVTSTSLETTGNLTCVNEHNALVLSSPAESVSPSVSKQTLPETPKSGKHRRLPKKRLFPSDDSCGAPLPSPCRTPSNLSGVRTNRCSDSPSIPSDILKDLTIIRTLRRSSYADGDSLVEVKPSSLPDSPTMFAYRSPTGCIRVPMDMQSNQNALTTYRNIKLATLNYSFPADNRYPMDSPLSSLKRKASEDSQISSDATDDSLNNSLSGDGLLTIFNDDHVSKSTQNIIDEWQKLQDKL